MAHGSRVVLIGIDSLAFAQVQRWVEKGHLPAFRQIIEQGAGGPLHSIHPYASCPGWACLWTGKDSSTLGIYHQIKRDADSYNVHTIDLTWDAWHPLWEITSEHQKTSIYINAPTAKVPDSNYHGKFVGGPIMEKPIDPIAYPPDLDASLKDQEYKIYTQTMGRFETDDDKRGYYQRVRDITEQQAQLAVDMYRKDYWDFFTYSVFYSDDLSHRFWKYMDPACYHYSQHDEFADVLLQYFQMVDSYLAIFLNELPQDANLIVVSDHGMGGMKDIVDFNAWLLQEGFMHLKTEKTHTVTLSGFRSTKLYPIIRNLYGRINGIGAVRALRDYIWKTVPESKRSWKDVDWEKTSVYCIGTKGFYVNLKGREPQGIISSGDDYEQVLQDLTDALRRLRDPDSGTPVVKHVYRPGDLFLGQHDSYPDLLIDFCEDSTDGFNYADNNVTAAPGTDIMYTNPVYSANHTKEGILLGYGPDIRPTGTVRDATILDIVPTVLTLMGIPLPSDIDGRLLTSFLKDNR